MVGGGQRERRSRSCGWGRHTTLWFMVYGSWFSYPLPLALFIPIPLPILIPYCIPRFRHTHITYTYIYTLSIPCPLPLPISHTPKSTLHSPQQYHGSPKTSHPSICSLKYPYYSTSIFISRTLQSYRTMSTFACNTPIQRAHLIHLIYPRRGSALKVCYHSMYMRYSTSNTGS